MRKTLAAILYFGIGVLLAGVASAGDRPVVVELYTSQGCSSCPPADKYLAELSKRDDVIALALHVDYWDYIGWKDIFANPAYTKRQKAYARAAGARTVYTPQMVIGGVHHVVGLRPMEVAERIMDHRDTPAPIALSVRRSGDRLDIAAQAMQQPKDVMIVQLVRYTPEQTVDIKRGENAGRTMRYTNIVTQWRPLVEWDGREPLSLSVEAPGTDPAVVIIQARGPGAILAAERLR